MATWFHGSTPVTAAVEEFDHEVVDLFHRARGRRFTWHEFQKNREPTQDALERYIQAVRKELKRPTLQVRIHYSRPGLPPPPATPTVADKHEGTG